VLLDLPSMRLPADRILESPQACPERAPHLREALGPEHEQENDEQEGEVKWIVESQGVSS
jgi:hypothetical protein